MFTGIVTALGRIRAISGEAVKRFEIEAPYAPDGIELGASIAHAGACLTVVDKGPAASGGWYCLHRSTAACAQSLHCPQGLDHD